MHTLHFTKIFTTGTLAGLTVSDWVSFPTAEQCHQAVANYQQLADRNGCHVGGWIVMPSGQVPPLQVGINDAKSKMEAALEAIGYDEDEIMIVMSLVGQLEAFVQRAAWDQQMSHNDRAGTIAQLRTAVYAKLGTKALAKDATTQQAAGEFWCELSQVEYFAHQIESTRQMGQADGKWLVQHGTVPAINASLDWIR